MPLNLTWRLLFKAHLVLLWSVLIQGCGFEKTMTFPSPSRKAAIEIWQYRFENFWGARVELVNARGRTVLDKRDRETGLYFVHVYWSPDETKVGVLATGFNFFHVAFDISAGKSIPFEDIRKDLGRSIQETYHVPHGEDPIGWAALSEAQGEFFKLHPEIRLTYH